MMGAEIIQAELFFLAPDDLHEHEKPYSMRYPPTIDIPQSNIRNESHVVEIRSMRPMLSSLDFDTCGFGIWAVEVLASHARSVLHVLAFLDPDSIPDSLIEQIVKSEITGISMPEECPKSKFEFSEARKELLWRSLIQRNPEKGDMWIYRLIQDAVRAKLTGAQRSMVFPTTVELVDRAWPKAKLDKRHNTERWGTCRRIYPHIQYLLSLYDREDLLIDADVEVKFAVLLIAAGW